MSEPVARWKCEASGEVQRVGYREVVRRAATARGLVGSVWNDTNDEFLVHIDVQGSSRVLGEFLGAITGEQGLGRAESVRRTGALQVDPSLTKFKVIRGDPALETVDRAEQSAQLLTALLGETRGIAKETHEIVNETRGISKETHEIANETRGISKETHEIANETRGIAKETREIVNETRSIAKETHEIASATRGIAEETRGIAAVGRETLREVKASNVRLDRIAEAMRADVQGSLQVLTRDVEALKAQVAALQQELHHQGAVGRTARSTG